MAESTMWWLLAGTAIGIELVTGTFYLLMVSVGLGAAAIAAHAGASSTVQIVVAALVGAGTVLTWRRYKQSAPTSAPASSNSDVNLDIGGTVHVDTWDANGTAHVKYRGANWEVSSASMGPLAAGTHQIVEVVGSRLVVKKL